MVRSQTYLQGHKQNLKVRDNFLKVTDIFKPYDSAALNLQQHTTVSLNLQQHTIAVALCTHTHTHTLSLSLSRTHALTRIQYGAAAAVARTGTAMAWHAVRSHLPQVSSWMVRAQVIPRVQTRHYSEIAWCQVSV